MIIEVLTLFPGMFTNILGDSMMKRAAESGAAQFSVRDIRDYCTDKHRMADDTPYGGGPGMVMKCEPIAAAFDAVAADHADVPPLRRVYLSPEGRPWNQRLAEEYAQLPGMVLLCGHYEGIDERVRELYVDEEISAGDFVLTGGELPAMMMIDSIVRLLPGVLGNFDSLSSESFGPNILLDHPHYTRPAEFRGLPVPEILTGGHHAKIDRWRREQALRRTYERRRDLIDRHWHELLPWERLFVHELRHKG